MLRDLGYKMSSVAVYLRRLRQAFRRAMLEAGLREDPFDLIDIETPAYERNALSAGDLQRLLAYRPHRSVDNHVRLIFLLGCFTGLAFSPNSLAANSHSVSVKSCPLAAKRCRISAGLAATPWK